MTAAARTPVLPKATCERELSANCDVPPAIHNARFTHRGFGAGLTRAATAQVTRSERGPTCLASTSDSGAVPSDQASTAAIWLQ
jgi:hypothetical protein